MNLDDRMKFYEQQYGADACVMPRVPTLARLDGRAFHSFTSGLKRPYDERFTRLMVDTTKRLVDETNARIGYTQSDEITLVMLDDIGDKAYFGGRLFKMISMLASVATLHFNRALSDYLPEKQGASPMFDCRVWSVPNKSEACNVLVWREQDATRNSVQAAAQSVFSHKQLHKKHTGELHDMLFEKGVNWNDYPSCFKRGTYIRRRVISSPFTTEEIQNLPPLHEARRNPNLMVDRAVIDRLEMPPLQRVANREAVVFDGADPVPVEPEIKA